jgi:uncharacterized YigZ family protein
LERYPVPARETRIEIKVVNSRFIATMAPTFTVDEAKAFISRIKDEFADASHNVSAYLIGHGASVVAHCTDDGEPAGTAGRPVLAVLRGSGLGDVAVVVTRYYGGTNLGTGGLVRAYGDAVREVLTVLDRAVKVATHAAEIVMPYNAFEQVRLLVTTHRGQIEGEDFAAEITMTARFAVEDFGPFQTALQEISSGKLEAQIVEENATTILPI